MAAAASNVTLCEHHSKTTTPTDAAASSQVAGQQHATSQPVPSQHHHDHSLRRREREKLLISLWSHAWTKRQSPEWKPRRASVATCQRRYNSNQSSSSISSSNSFNQNQQNPLEQPQQLQQRQRKQLLLEHPHLLCSSLEIGSRLSMAAIYQTLAETHDTRRRRGERHQSQLLQSPTTNNSRIFNDNNYEDSQVTTSAGDTLTCTSSALNRQKQQSDALCATRQESASPATATTSQRAIASAAYSHLLLAGSEEANDKTTRPQELTVGSQAEASAASNGSCISSGSEGSGNTVISAGQQQHTIYRPSIRKRRVQLNRLSLDSYLPAAFTMTDSEGSKKIDKESHKQNEKQHQPQLLPRPQNNPPPTCCSSTTPTTSASSSCSLSTASLAGELETSTVGGQGSQSVAVAAAAAAAAAAASVPLVDPYQLTTVMALNRDLQLQDKQRKSLIYSMALKKTKKGKMGSGGGCKMVGKMMERRQSSSGGGGIAVTGIWGGNGGCCCCCCPAACEQQLNGCGGGNTASRPNVGGDSIQKHEEQPQLRMHLHHHYQQQQHLNHHQQQQQLYPIQQPGGSSSKKTVSDGDSNGNNNSSPRQHPIQVPAAAAVKLVSSSTAPATATTTPMTCYHLSDQDKAAATTTEVAATSKPQTKSVRVERSASSGQMLECSPTAPLRPWKQRTSEGGGQQVYAGRENRSLVGLYDSGGCDSSSSVSGDNIASDSKLVKEFAEASEGEIGGCTKNSEAMFEQQLDTKRRLSSGGDFSTNSTNSCEFETILSEVDSESEGSELVENDDNKLMSRMIMLTKPTSEDNCDKNQAAGQFSRCCGHHHHQHQHQHDEGGRNSIHLDSQSPGGVDLDNDNQCDNDPDLESLIIESWLDDHPSFVQDYFLRKASRQLIDNWLLMHAKVSNTNLLSSQPDLSTAATLASAQTPPLGHTNSPNLQQHRVSSIGGFGRSTRSMSGQSGHATPVRKISATDFESRTGSGFLRPMVSTTPDGRPTFLSQPQSLCKNDLEETEPATRPYIGQQSGSQVQSRDTQRLVSGSNGSKGLDDQRQPLSLNESPFGSPQARLSHEENSEQASDLKTIADAARNDESKVGNSSNDENEEDENDMTMNREVKLIFELVKNICNDLDIKTLLHKILKNIAVLINADKSSLFLVCGQPGDPNRHLVSQLFNVDQDSELNNGNNENEFTDEANGLSSATAGNQSDCITIPWGTGLVGYVAESGQSVNIANCYDDPRFTNTIDKRTGYVTKHMLCAPILDKRNEIVGVAQVINKRDGNPFSKSDELKFKRYLQFCGIGLRNAQSYENCQLENRRNQVLLDLARMVFEEQSTIEQVVYRIMLHTQSLLECQRCQVLLIDDGSDDLEQLLQLPNSYSSSSSMGPSYLYQQPTRSINNNSTGENGTEIVAKPAWRPHCNAAAIATAGVEAAVTSEMSIHHDGNGDNNNNSNNNTSLDGSEGAISRHEDDDDSDAAGRNSIRQLEGATSAAAAATQLVPQLQQPQPKLFSLVFDLECDGNDLVMHSNKEVNPKLAGCVEVATEKRNLERRFPINIGITGYVAMTGETLNIEDAHQNERFDPSVDLNSNFRHKSILCMPIRNGQRQIIGVSQLINKKNGRPFNKNDEDLFEAFAIFCGLGIHNTLIYEKVLKIMAKQRVTFEVLSYHATAPLEEAKKLNSEIIPSCYALNLTSLKFNDFSLDEQFMLKSCLRFFLDLDLIRRFQIDQLVFCNWILSVQKNYRKVTYHPIVGGNGLKASPVRYHNWRHAFNVSQMMFAILINAQICQALGELETLALLIACLCHDLDHRGTNNSFQIKSASPLAELYSTSTMEHHHFDQCVMILNSQGNQILANLSPDEYSRVIVLLEEAILATDLANYFQKRESFFKLVNSNQFEWKHNPEHRSLLRCMLMTACDVAAITKPWPVQKVVADLVMSEFYQQGDIEKQELNIEPIDMMNRDKRSKLPEMQIGFIDSICAPIYAAFAKLFPHELSSLLDGCLTNRDIWTEISKSNQIEAPSLSPLVSHFNSNTTTTPLTILPENYTNQREDHISRPIALDLNQFQMDRSNSPVTSCSLISDHFELQNISVVDQRQQQYQKQRKSI